MHELDSSAVLDDLVRQFADPMAFFRELIQNAIDAGSGEVEIWFEHEPGADGGGMLVAHVDDFGEGMSREIIETRLVRLFSSSKDEDFTKIGRFGIGFVSVFAIQPEAVCVDTGRGGECWRVLFHRDRTYELIRLDQPVEGTQIQVFKPMPAAEYEAFTERAREVITRWCKHARAPVRVEGQEINAPFEVRDCLLHARFEEEGTTIVAGLTAAAQAPYGYYNRGLTLKEGEESPWPHVAIKIDSRYLEHTLTRDQVLRDRHFHKAMRLMEEVVSRLHAQLWDALEASAARYATSPEAAATHGKLARLLLSLVEREAVAFDRTTLKRPIFPVWVGQPLTGAALQKRAASPEGLGWDTANTPLIRALSAELPVLADDRQEATLHLALKIMTRGEIIPVRTRWCLLERAEAPPGGSALAEQLGALIRALGGRPEHIGFATFDECLPHRATLGLARDDGALRFGADALTATSRGRLVRCPHLWLNAAHSHIARCAALAATEPEFAAMTLLKLLVLSHEGLRGEDERIITDAALGQRARRVRPAPASPIGGTP